MSSFISSLKHGLSIKQKVILGVVVVFLSGVMITNVIIFERMVSQIEDMIVDKARSITIMGEAIREYISDNWGRGVYDKDYLMKDINGKFLYSVPIFSSISTMQKKAKELGYTFRVPKIYPRNKANEPDEYEKKVLEDLTAHDKKEFISVDWAGEKIRYFRPVRLSKDCLACHGDPATSGELWGNDEGKDPT
ncbi:MAG TPA: DUF3365 domain-containing protein, partial [Spirochaetota bacterium]